MSVSPRVELAIKHLESARAYMRGLVADLTPDEWFWTPQPPISHIAWQVGHLAVAEYGLMLFRQRGRQEVDGELMSGAFRKLTALESLAAWATVDLPSFISSFTRSPMISTSVPSRLNLPSGLVQVRAGESLTLITSASSCPMAESVRQ